MSEAAHAEGGDSQAAMIVIGVAIVVSLIAGVYFFTKSKLSSTEREGRDSVARSDVELITAQLQLYRSNCGMLPTQAQGLKALLEQPATPPLPKRWVQVTKELPIDPWGNDYNYAKPAVKSRGAFDVYSSGRDGKAGTRDDIGNWESPK